MNSYTIQDLTTADSLDLLQEFVANLGDAANTFRYFSKRELSIVKNHLVSLLLLDNGSPVAYGHLEQDDNIVWLGVCVLPNHKGKKLGLLVMNELLAEAKQKKIAQIDLTVDKENLPAIALYEKLCFVQTNVAETYYRYQLILK